MEVSNANLEPYLAALAADDAFGMLVRLVIEFKKSGGTKPRALELLHQLRVRSGAYEAEDSRDELICDVLDCVGGWCSGNNYIFAEDFDEKHFFRVLPGVA